MPFVCKIEGRFFFLKTGTSEKGQGTSERIAPLVPYPSSLITKNYVR